VVVVLSALGLTDSVEPSSAVLEVTDEGSGLAFSAALGLTDGE
jgi:hypothetical protein